MIKNLELEPITIHFHTTEIFQLQLNKKFPFSQNSYQ